MAQATRSKSNRPDQTAAFKAAVGATVRAIAGKAELEVSFSADRPILTSDKARLTNRAEPNLLRTLGKLEAFGFLEMRTVARRRVPTAKVDKLRLEIDPYAMLDRIEIMPARR